MESFQKILKGLTQKQDEEIREGLSTLQDMDLQKEGSAASVKENDISINYGASVHSMSMEGLTSRDPMITCVGTNVYRGHSLLDGTFSGQYTEFSAMNGVVYLVNKTDGMWSFDGAVLKKAGAPVPDVGTFAASDGGAAIVGGTGFESAGASAVYNFRVTFITSTGAEGNGSDAISLTLATNDGMIDLTDIPVNTDADYNIIARRVYIQGGEGGTEYTDYSLVLTLSDNTTTSYSGLLNSDVDESATLTTNNNLPPSGRFIFEHSGVMFMSGFDSNRQSLRYSKALGPEQWPTAQDINVSRSGDPVMWGVKWRGSAFLFTRKRVFELIGAPGSGTLTTNFYVKETSAETGTIAPRSVVATPYGIFYQAEDGIRRFDGSGSVAVSDPAQELLDDRNTQDSVENLSCAAFWDDKLVFSYAKGASTFPNYTLIYDFDRNEWSSHDGGYWCLWADRKTNVLYGGTLTGVERMRKGRMYKAWAMKKAFSPAPQGLTHFQKFEVDMEGDCTVNVYLDGSLAGTYAVSLASRDFAVRRFPGGVARRADLELVGDRASTQARVYGIGIKAESNGEM